eukprot:GHVO01004726.1.p1 GENE.GHVO01004726.1~~GHVO01004726.1.p1  ORF type:complete len:423 (+),score=98.96 GHVO01004726.1:1-1269(+)
MLDGVSLDTCGALVDRAVENEKKTRHDVKAIEYVVRDFIIEHWTGPPSPARVTPLVHIFCTSEDVNNLAIGLMLKNTIHDIIRPAIGKAETKLDELAEKWKSVPLLARTHGQPASPTTLGKEVMNFRQKLRKSLKQLDAIEYDGKMNGAVGNFNAHMIACPDLDWPELTKKFVEQHIGLRYDLYSTQIQSRDYIAELFDCLSRLNTHLINLCVDMWMYISRDLLSQAPASSTEVGSSTMPHKINPIEFENGEGNLGLSNSMLKFMGSKLIVSRLQRDLSDSTVLRNLGVGLGYSLVAYESIHRGLSRVVPNEDGCRQELEMHPQVISEAYQTVMRKLGIPDAYEVLHAATRGTAPSLEGLRGVLACMPPSEERDRLYALTPGGYMGMAERLAEGGVEGGAETGGDRGGGKDDWTTPRISNEG